MTRQIEKLGRNLAKNIEALRAARDLSQTDLAKKANVPRSTIGNMESGDANPSLQNLAAVAKALSVPIEELLATPRLDCKLIKRSEIDVHQFDRGRVDVHKLLPDPLSGFEFEKIVLRKNGFKPGIPHLNGTREYLACLQGSVLVYVAGEKFVLSEGDVLAFPGDQSHSYKSNSDTNSVCISVVAFTPKQKR